MGMEWGEQGQRMAVGVLLPRPGWGELKGREGRCCTGVFWVAGGICHGEQGLFGREAAASRCPCCPARGSMHIDVSCSASWSCETGGAGWSAQSPEQGTSPLHDTPVPSMVTLHTAQTGGFFRKTFSRKLCGSAFLG